MTDAQRIVTPGPWRVSRRNPKRIVSMGKYRETDRRSIPCTVASCESEDDAARIIQCVNAHDELMALASALRQHASEVEDHTPDSFRRGVIGLALRAAAIAKATGGAA